MTIDTLIMLAGALVAILPFLGIPTSGDTIAMFILGVVIISLGIVVRRRGTRIEPQVHNRDPHFVDTNPVHEKGENELP